MSMKSSSPASERERAIDELVQGRQFAYKLKAFLFLQKSNNNQSLPPAPAEDLVLNILNSFTNTLSILNPPAPHLSPTTSSSHRHRNSDDSADSSATKYPRGCYKRRRTWHSWTRDSPNLVDDGNAWRKYGQKLILNAKYPRNYYRCSHKHEQGCEAKKQVQRIEEDPPVYRTIYNGNHTCNNFVKANEQLFIDYHESDDSSFLLSFNNNNHYQHHPFFTTSEDQFTQNNINQSSSSSSDYLLSTDDQALNNSSSCTTATTDDHCTFHVDHLMDVPSQFHDDDVFAVCI